MCTTAGLIQPGLDQVTCTHCLLTNRCWCHPAAIQGFDFSGLQCESCRALLWCKAVGITGAHTPACRQLPAATTRHSDSLGSPHPIYRAGREQTAALLVPCLHAWLCSCGGRLPLPPAEQGMKGCMVLNVFVHLQQSLFHIVDHRGKNHYTMPQHCKSQGSGVECGVLSRLSLP